MADKQNPKTLDPVEQKPPVDQRQRAQVKFPPPGYLVSHDRRLIVLDGLFDPRTRETECELPGTGGDTLLVHVSQALTRLYHRPVEG